MKFELILIISVFILTASAASSSCPTYIVADGDSSFGIAEKNGITQDELAQALEACGQSLGSLEIGLEICLPGADASCLGGSKPAVDPTPSSSDSGKKCRIYIVKSSDETLSAIAAAFGLDTNDLVEANPSASGTALQSGQPIKIPPFTADCGTGTVVDAPKAVVVAPPVKASPSPDPVPSPAKPTPVPPVVEASPAPKTPVVPSPTPVVVTVPSPVPQTVPQKTVSPKPVALLPPPATTTTSDDGGSNTGAIVGGVVGGIAAIALIAGGVWYWRKRKQAVPGVHLQADRNDGWVDPLDNAAVKAGPGVVAPSSTAPVVIVE